MSYSSPYREISGLSLLCYLQRSCECNLQENEHVDKASFSFVAKCYLVFMQSLVLELFLYESLGQGIISNK